MNDLIMNDIFLEISEKRFGRVFALLKENEISFSDLIEDENIFLSDIKGLYKYAIDFGFISEHLS